MDNIITPAYVLKDDALQKSIFAFKDALNTFFPKNVFSYSLKTNSFPYILKKINENEGYAEVVSHDEYQMARLCGFEIDRIVYNGPLKSKETFLEAIINNAIVNIETKRELLWLKDLPTDQIFSIGIRLNIDLNIVSPEDAKENEDYSRFGFSEEAGEFLAAIDVIEKMPNIRLNGLHVHRTTAYRSIAVYEKIAEYVGKIILKYNLAMDYIDMGGGYYGIMDGKPSFTDYCQVINRGLSKFLDLTLVSIIVEPGNAIVASAFDFISEVIDVKKIRDFYVITTDGSRNDLDPFYKKSNYFKDIICKQIGETVEKQIIAGGTCLEYDKIFELHNDHLLKEGDRIVYKSVGAYTMTLSPLFIRFFPNVYLQVDGQCKLIRKQWEASDFFEKYKGEI